MVSFDTRFGLSEEDFNRECCYTCTHYKTIKREGICKMNNKCIKSSTTYKCKSYEKVKLLQCEICSRFYRNLGLHVRSHGLTADEYKEKYGLNRRHALVCEATKKSLGGFITAECKAELK